MEQEFNKQDIIKNLHEGICVVTFTKMNGDTRVMKCTLESQYLPENTSETNDVREGFESVVNCWDVEAAGWRSFRIDRITRFNAFAKSDNGVYKQT